MKTPAAWTAAAVMATTIAAGACAGQSAPPPAERQPTVAPAAAADTLESAPYLGVATTRVTPALRAALTLPVGVGLVVDHTERDSPAAEAGVKQYDVLQKFNDQILVDPRQLAILIRMAKPGDAVTLTFLRAGQPQAARVTLVERRQPPIDDDGNDVVAGVSSRNQTMKEAMTVLRKKLAAASAVSYEDGEHALEIVRRDGRRFLQVRNKAGDVIFDGPFETPEERAAVPEELALKLQLIEGQAQVRTAPDRPAKTKAGGDRSKSAK